MGAYYQIGPNFSFSPMSITELVLLFAVSAATPFGGAIWRGVPGRTLIGRYINLLRKIQIITAIVFVTFGVVDISLEDYVHAVKLAPSRYQHSDTQSRKASTPRS
jgi:hypothetical protein